MVNFLKNMFQGLKVIIVLLFHENFFCFIKKNFYKKECFYLKVGPEYQATNDFLAPELTGLTLCQTSD